MPQKEVLGLFLNEEKRQIVVVVLSVIANVMKISGS